MTLNSKNNQNICDVYMTAGETIAALSPVYMMLSSGGGTAGRVYKTDSSAVSSSSACWFVGFSLINSTAGNPIKIRIAGILETSGLTTGTVYYVGSSGTITSTAPDNSLQVGIALSSTKLLINNKMSTNETFYSSSIFKGYICGGQTASSGFTNNTNIYYYPSDTVAALSSANLTQSRASACCMTNINGNVGYMIGGNSTSTAELATADKITYSTEVTAAQTSANLSTATLGADAISSRNYSMGYIAGGNTNTIVATGYKVTFSTEITVAQTSINLSQARQDLAGVGSDILAKCYWLGGSTTTTSPVATADKTLYSTDTTAANTSANLGANRRQVEGISYDSGGKGYVAGGLSATGTGTQVATAYVITYSTDITAAQASANLSGNRSGPGGVSDTPNDKGYWLGGSSTNASFLTITNKITFPNDTTSAQASVTLSLGRRLAGSMSANSV